MQDRLHLLAGHNEIAVHRGQVVAARKGGPGVEAHRLPNFDLVHGALPADADFHHAILFLTFVAENFLQGRGINFPLLGRHAAEPGGRLSVLGPDLLNGIPNALDGGGQLLLIAMAADVHEIDLRLVEKEVIVESGHF